MHARHLLVMKTTIGSRVDIDVNARMTALSSSYKVLIQRRNLCATHRYIEHMKWPIYRVCVYTYFLCLCVIVIAEVDHIYLNKIWLVIFSHIIFFRHRRYLITQTSAGTTPDINPLRAKFFRGHINIYLHFMSILPIDFTQVLKILPRIREGPTYSTESIPWLLMSWRRKEPGHQQPWYGPR